MTDRWLAAMRGIERGIPVAAPEAAAAFRIVFVVAALCIFDTLYVYPELLAPLPLAQAKGLYGDTMRWLAANPTVVTLIRPALLVTGVLAAAGVATRVSFFGFAAAGLLWNAVFVLQVSAHASAVLGLTLLALVPARLGDAWSIDALIRHPRRFAPARAYGYAFWVPGLVLGTAFAGAAWSKLSQGPKWILNGTVRYHFVTDLEQAWVSWGPTMTAWHPIAVAASAFAVGVETFLVAAMFLRPYWWRAAVGAAAAVLLAGFMLFQGVLWLAWWILLIGFLPWHLIRASGAPRADQGPAGGITIAQAIAIVAILVQQVAASAMRIEARPLISAYDMYSTTYDSLQDYEAASNLVYRVVGVAEGGSTALPPACVVSDKVAAMAREALAGDRDDLELLRKALAPCLRVAPDVQRIALEGDRRVYDWNSWQFVWKRRLDVVGPIDVDRLRQ